MGYAGVGATALSLFGGEEATPELVMITRAAFLTATAGSLIADNLRAAGGETRDFSVDVAISTAADKAIPGESAIAQGAREILSDIFSKDVKDYIKKACSK
jgi:hypothetical protein